MTTAIGVTCLYSMIYLPAYLHLCESAEALGSIVPATGYPELINLLLTYLHKEHKGPHGEWGPHRRCYSGGSEDGES